MKPLVLVAPFLVLLLVAPPSAAGEPAPLPRLPASAAGAARAVRTERSAPATRTGRAARASTKETSAEAKDDTTALEDLVTQQVQQSLPPGLDLIDLRIPHRIAFPARATVAIDWPEAPRSGRVSVLVVAREGAREVGRTWALVELRSPRRVLVADRDLRKGAPISEGDLVVEERPVEAGEGLQLDPVALLGSPLLRDVPAGRALSPGDVNVPAPSPRGTTVKVVVHGNGVTVATLGELERPLRLGQLGQARLLQQRRLVEGRLVDRETFVVEEDTP